MLIKIRGLTKDRVRLALLLPSAQFFAWLVLVPVTALLTYGRLSEMRKAEAGRTHIQTKDFEVTIRPDNRLLFAFGPICERRFHGVVNIDLPGVVVGAPLTNDTGRAFASPERRSLGHRLVACFNPPVLQSAGLVVDRPDVRPISRSKTASGMAGCFGVVFGCRLRFCWNSLDGAFTFGGQVGVDAVPSWCCSVEWPLPHHSRRLGAAEENPCGGLPVI